MDRHHGFRCREALTQIKSSFDDFYFVSCNGIVNVTHLYKRRWQELDGLGAKA
jgi:hypothetical protein